MGPQLATISLVLLTLFVNSHSTTVPLVAYTSEDVGEGYDEGSGETAGFFEMEPTTEQPDPIDFDCNGLENGNYADGCSNVFYTCSNNVAFKRYCPQGTVYNPHQKTCDYECTEAVTTTTTAYSESTTTRRYDRSEYTTTPQDDVASTTVVYETTPASDDTVTTTSTTTTTQAPIVCQEGQVTTFGMCASRFNRCQSNTVRAKQCPVNTLFESSLLLCVFDLPQCQPVTIPGTPVYNSYGPPSDTIVSPFDENVNLKPMVDRKRNYHHGPAPVRRPGYGNGNSYIENPFFIPRHYPRHGVRRHHSGPEIDSPFSTAFRGRAALNDQFKDYRRASMGKINYGDARKVEGNKRFLIDDEFDGPNSRYVQSSIQQVFPEHRHSKKRLGPREDPDGYNDDKTFDGKDLFGATRRKRSAYYGSQPSGYTQISARQAQVNKDCQQHTTPTFLTFGDCFDQFIYCSGNGVNRMAACPIGETFNKVLRACSETCGISTSVVTVTTGTQTSDDSTWSSINTGNDNSANQLTDEQVYATHAPSEDQSWNEQPTTTIAPAGGRCSSVPSGLFSLGCSQKYIQCSNGAAIVRNCDGSLYFSEDEQSCTFKDQVPECGALDTSTWSPIVTLPANADPYKTPSDDTQTTTQTPVGDRCAYESSGLFSVGCSQKYIQCSSGAALVRSCSGALYFSQAKQSCDSREQVSECGAQDTTTWSPAVTLPADDTTDSYGNPFDDTQATTRTPVGDRCAYESSGLFSVGCSQKYIQCSNGAALVRSCSGVLYFSQAKQSCDSREHVSECGAQDTTTWSPAVTFPADDTTPDETTDSYGNPFDDTQTTTPTPVGDRCAYESSGLFSVGCSQKYIQCSSGAALVRSCSGALYFNQAKQSCDSREQVSECGAQDTTTWSPIVTVPADAEPYRTPSDDTQTTTPTPVGDRCAYESSGLFSVGCSQKYIQCSSGAALVRSCSGALYFNQAKQSCDSREQVSECGAQDTTTWSPIVTVPADAEPYRTPSDDTQVTTQTPVGDHCAYVSSGLFAVGCSQKYIQCTNGAAIVRNCGGSLYFSEDQQSCIFRDQVPECGAQGTTTWSPVVTLPTHDTTSDETVVPYVTVPSNDYNTTSSYGEETTTSSYGEYTNPAEDSGLIQPLPYVTLEDILSTTQATTTIGNDETTVSYVTVPSDDYTTTSSYGDKASTSEATSSHGTYTTPAEDTTSIVVTDTYNRADDSEDEEEEIGYNHKCTVGSRASTGFCVQSYLECTANVFVEKSCRVGKLFDTHANRCVPRIACGKEAIREVIKDVIATTAAPTKKIDGRCAHVDGERAFALGSCSSNYVRCSYGAAKLQYCSGNQVFSNAKAECVNRESTSECNVAQNPPVKSYYNNNEQSAYCDGKADGLYGNKRDCSAILQCFGGELFEHTSCPSNLAFNELTSKCDYPQKVNGCENHGKTDGVCTEHGSFIANVDDCSVFYRCVWGRKVVMRCPSGTVFNPALSVCDWPSAVPSCGGSSYNDDNLGY